MSEEKIKIRLKNIYNKKPCRDFPATSQFWRTGETVSDFDGNIFEVVYRGKPEFYVDIPINQNDIGLDVEGYFVLIGKAHPLTRDFKALVEHRKPIIKKIKCKEELKKLLELREEKINKTSEVKQCHV